MEDNKTRQFRNHLRRPTCETEGVAKLFRSFAGVRKGEGTIPTGKITNEGSTAKARPATKRSPKHRVCVLPSGKEISVFEKLKTSRRSREINELEFD